MPHKVLEENLKKLASIINLKPPTDSPYKGLVPKYNPILFNGYKDARFLTVSIEKLYIQLSCTLNHL